MLYLPDCCPELSFAACATWCRGIVHPANPMKMGMRPLKHMWWLAEHNGSVARLLVYAAFVQ